MIAGSPDAEVAQSPPLRREIHAAGLFVGTVLRHRYVLVRATLLVGFVYGLIGVSLPRQWTSQALVTPHARRGATALGGLAAQLGLGETQGSNQSPAFYVQLSTSDELLGRLAESEISLNLKGEAGNVSVAEALKIKGDGALRRADAIRRLKRIVSSSANPRTSVIAISVRSTNAEVSRQVAERLLRLLDEFNQVTRASQARQERIFTERRSGDAKRELSAAEENLRIFLDRNRQYTTSPMLVLENARLEREITRLVGIYTMLTSAFEQARIDEVRDTPVLAVLQPPRAPARPDPRGLLARTAFIMVVSFATTLTVIVLSEQYRKVESVEGDFWLGFRNLLREVGADLRRPWQLITGNRK